MSAPTDPITLSRAAYADLMDHISALVQHEGAAYALLRQVKHAITEPSPTALADVEPELSAWIAAYDQRRRMAPPTPAETL